MAYNNYQQVPFWDFVRAFDHNGAGVDRPAEDFSFWGHPPHPHYPPHGVGFPFGGPQFWGRGGHGGRGGRNGRGRHCRRPDDSGEERAPRGTSEEATPNPENPEGGPSREGSPRGHRGPRRFGHHGREGSPRGHQGPRGFGHHGRGEYHRGGPHAHGRRGPPPFGGPGGPGGFDLNALVEALSAHPLAQAFRTYAEQSGLGGEAQRSGETLVPEDTDNETFTPPVDVFSTETHYILHVALPGARKEDVGVNWDEEKGVLNLAGVVYRQGDEEFLKSLTQSERKVGVFERTIKLPPGDVEKEEVDGDAITAKLEDGVLVVTVPKVEKEWTEVKRVDIL